MLKKRIKKYSSLFFLSILISAQTLNAQGYICAIGGGNTSSYWADQPFSWMIEKADSGKVIILSVESSTSLITYFQNLGASEAVNLIIPNISTAQQESTYDEIKTAKVIYIVGGDLVIVEWFLIAKCRCCYSWKSSFLRLEWICNAKTVTT